MNIQTSLVCQKDKGGDGMLDPAIDAFFTETKLSMEDWLPKAARIAGSRAFATHPSKFSHPDTGVGIKNKKNQTYVTPVTHCAKKTNDGFLRSGNVKSEEFNETVGDAAALKVDSFLKLRMADGNILLDHIRSETDLARRLLNIQSETYDSLRKGFLAIINPVSVNATSSKIKQVYFPVPKGYHLISLLSNSGIIYELKRRINIIRFKDEVKELREIKRKNEYSEKGFIELYNLTTIGYGGTKPQNISALNKDNGGKAHLLMSMPPTLKKLNTRFPRQNFFKESLRDYEYREIFNALHKLFKTDYNNHRIREGRDYRIQSLVDLIIDRMWAVRAVCNEQYKSESSKLKPHQKFWLCDEFIQEREIENEWLDTLCKEIAVWIIRRYEKLMGKNAYKLGEAERIHFYEIILENKEALR
jgi:CRISPR-associated protein Csy1